MSKPASATTPKTTLPTVSAWARGPPQNAAASSSSPRPQSPATSQHQRKPSGLINPASAANALKDGVAVRPGAGAGAPASRPASQVVFGSLDDPSATLSSSPAPPAPPISTATKVQSFGSIPVTPATPSSAAPALPHTPLKPNGTSNGKPGSSSASASTVSTAASTPAPSTPGTPAASEKRLPKVDVRSLFMKTSAPSPASPTPKAVPEVSAPAPRHPSVHPPPHPGSAGPQFANFPPHMRPGSSGPPRSPQFNRAVPNGMPRPPGPPGAPQAMGSPRLAPQQIPQQGMPPPQQGMQPGMQPGAMWMPQQGYYAYTPYYGYIPQPGPPPPGPDGQPQPHPHWMQGAPPPQAHMGAPPLPHAAVASPRTQPPPLAVSPAPPPTSSTPPVTTAPPPAQQQNARPAPTPMSPQAPSFVPRTTPRPGGSSIRIVNPSSGAPVQLPNKENGTPTSTPVATSAPSLPTKTENRRSVIKIESPADKAKREEEEREKKRAEEEAKKKVEDEKRKKEEEEKARKQAEERKRKEAEEAKRKEEAERKRKLEEEQAAKRKAEEDRKKKEADEAEAAARKKAEEEAAAAATAAATAAAEAKRKADDEEAARVAEEERKKKADAAEAEAKAKEETDKFEEDEKKDEETELTSSPTPAPAVVLKPSAPDTRRRPGPINIDAARAPMTPGPMSALATARIITDINQIQYPDNIKSPRVELNMNAKEGKFRYDRDFLMQFMEVCKEKPDQLPPVEALGIEPIGAPDSRSRRSNMPPPMSRQNSTHGLGFSAGGPGSGFKNPMGSFNTGGSRPSSISGGPSSGVNFPRGAPMARTPSQTGSNSGRTRSQRGKVRDKTLSNAAPQSLPPVLQSQFEPVQALQHSDNAWSTQRRGGGNTPGDSPEVVERKVKALLNKLTMERFDSISDQIIEWANKSEKEKDGRTLIQVIRLVFEKATDEATWSHMYARLCRKMMEQISDGVMDEGIKNAEGQPIKGGLLFRKYLLNRCQEDFERGWSVQAQTAAAAKEKAADDAAKKKSNEASGAQGGDEELYSDEYYAAQKAKRRGLGLVRFIGELFKLQMLTERIMHECIKKLLSNVDNPGEEEIESICKLLSTVGQALDTSKARSHMDIYFKRMRDLSDSPNIDSRMRYMLQDVIELRERKWIPRNATAAPTTLSAVHDQAAKGRTATEKETASRMSTMSRGSLGRGDNRSDYGSHTGADGWSPPASRAPASEAGDLSQFGKTSNSASGVVSPGPTSVFAGKKGEKDELTASSTRRNPFAALTQNPGENAAEASTLSHSPGTSVDFSQSGPRGAGSSRELLLGPCWEPHMDFNAGLKVLSEAQIKKQIEEDTDEFFVFRRLDGSDQYFDSLLEGQRHRLVQAIFNRALEGKDAEATLAGTLFALVLDKGKVTLDTLEMGFSGTIEFLDDVAVDAPAAYTLAAKMLHLSKFDQARVQRLAEQIAAYVDPVFAPQDRLLDAFYDLSSVCGVEARRSRKTTSRLGVERSRITRNHLCVP
ncbi:hypothetical protein AURDEDRAFT_115891 [Auricularia subglabra TFB-10046 SS5]|nr:hypothetical protein AURDEDRAFT_115891 [Auricularia subglabra TFB-10046 SS5]